MTHDSLKALITTALAEDIGAGDITSQVTIPAGTQASAQFVAREPLVACGLFIPAEVFSQLGAAIRLEMLVEEGAYVAKGTTLLRASGNAHALLTGERTALNIMQRMSGVATLTREYVQAVKGTKAVILDTRKTMPGLRALDKYAVTVGGGQNHRMRLDDMVLIKDNHIAVGFRNQDSGFKEWISKIRNELSSLNPEPRTPNPIVIECDTIAQVAEALAAKPDRILLDNMTLLQLREAVALSAGNIPLEASGGVSLETVSDIARTGVDYISVGAITHSARGVDIGLDIALN